jgi:ligand-binding sensor domain-containing protein
MDCRSVNHIRTTLFIGTVLLIHFSHLHSQKEDYTMEQIPMVKELSHISVQCVLQDSAGFMWFGSMTILDRFDT